MLRELEESLCGQRIGLPGPSDREHAQKIPWRAWEWLGIHTTACSLDLDSTGEPLCRMPWDSGGSSGHTYQKRVHAHLWLWIPSLAWLFFIGGSWSRAEVFALREAGFLIGKCGCIHWGKFPKRGLVSKGAGKTKKRGECSLHFPFVPKC